MEINFNRQKHKAILHLFLFFSFIVLLSSCGGRQSDLCGNDYHLEAGRCEYNSRTCVVLNGSGAQTWHKDGFNACVPSCDAGYDNKRTVICQATIVLLLRATSVSGNPGDFSWIGTTGLTSEAESVAV